MNVELHPKLPSVGDRVVFKPGEWNWRGFEGYYNRGGLVVNVVPVPQSPEDYSIHILWDSMKTPESWGFGWFISHPSIGIIEIEAGIDEWEQDFIVGK